MYDVFRLKAAVALLVRERVDTGDETFICTGHRKNRRCYVIKKRT